MADKKEHAGDEGKEPTFEQMLGELEAVVEALESGELELAESLAKFKHGIELSKRCRAMLDEAQQTVEQLSGDGSETVTTSSAPESGETSD